VICPPHPFVIGRHDGLVTDAHVFGAQHVPPKQVSLGAAHDPQSTVDPQPSLWAPHAVAAQVFGVQVVRQTSETQ
jgi:hypothetical protein